MYVRSKVDLKSLAAHCEANYWRMRALLRTLFSDDDLVQGGRAALVLPNLNVSLSLFICDVARYTVTLSLNIQSLSSTNNEQPLEFSKNLTGFLLPAPIDLRIYEDMQVAEVINFAGHGAGWARYDYPNDAMLQPDEKLQQNALLGQWLSQALNHGVIQDKVFEFCPPGVVEAEEAGGGRALSNEQRKGSPRKFVNSL